MDEKIMLRLDSALKHIRLAQEDLDGVSLDDLRKSLPLQKAVCSSLVQIGETMKKIRVLLEEKYPKLPWRFSATTRNFLVHDYEAVNSRIVYLTVKEDLPVLEAGLLAIKNDFENGILVTERLILRKFRLTDAPLVFQNWASDSEVTKYLTWPNHKNVQETEKIVKIWVEEEGKPGVHRYTITEKGRDEPIGGIDVVEYLDDAPVLGYCLSRKHWNKGYMTEAAKAFIQYLFDIGYDSIKISAMKENIGSNRVIAKCGFRFVKEEHLEHISPWKEEPADVNWYEISRK